MVAAVFCYIWFVITTSGVERLKALSELCSCLSACSALLFATKNVNMLLLELNGLSRIVGDRSVYGLIRLLNDASVKKVKFYGIMIVAVNASLYAYIVTTRGIIGFQSNFHHILNMIGLVSGGVLISTIYHQTWIKMFFMIELFRNSYLEMKKVLCSRIEYSAGFNLEVHIQKMIRLQVALVRNYKECSRFWSPSMAICLIITNGNLIIAFYVMVTCLARPTAGYDFDVQMQTRTYILILALIVVHATQQRLHYVVSKSSSSFHFAAYNLRW